MTTQTRHPSDELTEIVIVLDRSGSMSSIKDDMDGGLWTLIREQHEQPGRCRVSLYQFDDQWEVAFEGKPAGDVRPDDCRLVPRGSTALHDAVVRTLSAVEARILTEPELERPSKVAVVVITDGHENASTESDREDARKAIQRATERLGWSFVYLAADAEGFDDGVQMAGDYQGATVAAYSRDGVRDMHAATSVALSDYRAGRSRNVDVWARRRGQGEGSQS